MRSRRSSRTIWGARLVAVVGTALAATGAGATDSVGVPLLVDEARILKPAERAKLEARLADAQAAIDSPVIIHIIKEVQAGGIVTEAHRRFTERKLASLGKNPVLLLFAANQRTAALETGKGAAGIVPELEARTLLRRLEARWAQRGPLAALDRAIDDIVESAEETSERRRPLPRSDTPAESASAAKAPPLTERPTRLQSSRLPLAVAVAVAILLALGLRRRAQLKAARGGAPAVARARTATASFEADRTSRLRDAFRRPPAAMSPQTADDGIAGAPGAARPTAVASRSPSTATAPRPLSDGRDGRPEPRPTAPAVASVDEDEPTLPRRTESSTRTAAAATPNSARRAAEADRRLPPPPPPPRQGASADVGRPAPVAEPPSTAMPPTEPPDGADESTRDR